jgi:hypothetical protein
MLNHMYYQLSTEEAWRMIRSLRHKPPKHAEKGDRKLMFSAAIEQSEQFFKLSDAAGYEIKPILLYYGLNQAARAIAASMAEGGQKWELEGHGITSRPLNTALGELLVVNAGRQKPGAFEVLAAILNSPSLPRRVSVRDVWMSLPDAATFPLHDTGRCGELRSSSVVTVRTSWPS